MALFEQLKSRAGQLLLQREQIVERSRRGVNLKTAQRVAVLFVVNTNEDRAIFERLLSELKEDFRIPEVYAYVYFPKWRKNEQIPDIKHPQSYYLELFGRHHLNWHFKPVEVIRPDAGHFDLLLDLSLEPLVPMQYLLRQVAVSMQAGTNLSNGEECYDFMLELMPDTDRAEAWAQMRFYLSNINLQ